MVPALSADQTADQFQANLLQPAAVRVPFVLQEPGDFRIRLNVKLGELLDLEVNHFLQKLHEFFRIHGCCQGNIHAGQLQGGVIAGCGSGFIACRPESRSRTPIGNLKLHPVLPS